MPKYVFEVTGEVTVNAPNYPAAIKALNRDSRIIGKSVRISAGSSFTIKLPSQCWWEPPIRCSVDANRDTPLKFKLKHRLNVV